MSKIAAQQYELEKRSFLPVINLLVDSWKTKQGFQIEVSIYNAGAETQNVVIEVYGGKIFSRLARSEVKDVFPRNSRLEFALATDVACELDYLYFIVSFNAHLGESGTATFEISANRLTQLTQSLETKTITQGEYVPDYVAMYILSNRSYRRDKGVSEDLLHQFTFSDMEDLSKENG